MNDAFRERIRTAAVAMWWVVLVALAVVLLQWVIYLTVLYSRPAWLLAMWGPGFDWAFVQMVWFWGIAVLKFLAWVMAMVALWLTLWARGLRKRTAD